LLAQSISKEGEIRSQLRPDKEGVLASCAQLASYLCLLIYVTEGEKASTRQPKVR
jgi:hypothetical protein